LITYVIGDILDLFENMMLGRIFDLKRDEKVGG
jgi:hypothetical protein